MPARRFPGSATSWVVGAPARWCSARPGSAPTSPPRGVGRHRRSWTRRPSSAEASGRQFLHFAPDAGPGQGGERRRQARLPQPGGPGGHLPGAVDEANAEAMVDRSRRGGGLLNDPDGRPAAERRLRRGRRAVRERRRVERHGGHGDDRAARPGRVLSLRSTLPARRSPRGERGHAWPDGRRWSARFRRSSALKLLAPGAAAVDRADAARGDHGARGARGRRARRPDCPACAATASAVEATG